MIVGKENMNREEENRNQIITVHEFLESYRRYLDEDPALSGKTPATYSYLIEKHLIHDLGEYQLSELDSDILNSYLKQKLSDGRLDNSGGLSPTTVSELRTILNSAFKYAKCNHYCVQDMNDLVHISFHQPEISIFNREETGKMVRYLTQHPTPYNSGVLLALVSGIRIGELCALTWGDLNLDEGVLQITKSLGRLPNPNADTDGHRTHLVIAPPKTRNSIRSIPLPPEIIDLLRKQQQPSDVYLLTGRRKCMEPSSCSKRFRNLLKKLDIPARNFHTLRHTFATACIRDGADPKTVSMILGHASVNITMLMYVHPSLEDKRRVMEQVYTHTYIPPS